MPTRNADETARLPFQKLGASRSRLHFTTLVTASSSLSTMARAADLYLEQLDANDALVDLDMLWAVRVPPPPTNVVLRLASDLWV